METKQTAVEFIVEQLETIIFYSDEAIENIIEQAKQMEKEQIIDAEQEMYNKLVRMGRAFQRNL